MPSLFGGIKIKSYNLKNSKQFFTKTIYLIFMVLIPIITLSISIYFLNKYIQTENLKFLVLTIAFFGGSIVGLIEFFPFLVKRRKD